MLPFIMYVKSPDISIILPNVFSRPGLNCARASSGGWGDEPMAEAALDAFKLFGKGQGHKAQLNIVDCAGVRTRQDARPALAVQGQ